MERTLTCAPSCKAKDHQRALRAVARDAGLEVLPGEPPADVYLDRKPGGSENKQVNRRFDVGITLTEQNTRKIQLVDLKFTATTKGGAAAKPNEKPGDAATVAELGKVQFYNRTFQPHANGPKVAIRGFAQETEGPLGGYAKTLLKACAKATPAYGMPGQCPEALRYRYILERFSVLVQKSTSKAAPSPCGTTCASTAPTHPPRSPLRPPIPPPTRRRRRRTTVWTGRRLRGPLPVTRRRSECTTKF